jgi:predicted lipoprotein with Yx(FWY)xxD motif
VESGSGISRLIPVLLVALLLGIAGCGGEGSADTSGETDSSSDQRAGAGRPDTGSGKRSSPRDGSRRAGDGGKVIASHDSQFGTILFDDDRRAVYLFDRESSNRSRCYAECAIAWPPVLTKASPRGNGAASTSLLGTTARNDGTTQVTYNDHPLYYYRDDPRGEVLCQNVVEFGGRWLVLDTRGDAVQ